MVQTITLKNGLRIVLEKLPFVRSVAFGIWVKTGSRNELQKQAGLSHFMEHMLFKGTNTRTAAEIAEEMDALGGHLNAFTGKESTCYYSVTLDNHFDTALDVLSDMFFNSKFDEGDIKTECGVIVEEINMYEDTPDELVFDLLQEGAFKNDALGLPIIGNEATISKFNKQTFKDYHKSQYCPQNTVISLAGNFDIDEIVKKVEARFSDFEANNSFQTPKINPIYTPTVVAKEKDIEQVHMVMGFPGVKIGDDNSYVLSVLNTILGGGMSSRLFQTIREKHGLSYSVYSYNASFSDTGMFQIYAGLNPTQTEKVLSLMFSEIKRLKSEPITQIQLEKTKEQLKSKYFLMLESSHSRMNSIGRTMLMLDKVVTEEYVTAQIDAVTLDRIYKLYDEIFNLSNVSLAAVGKIGGLNFSEMISNGR